MSYRLDEIQGFLFDKKGDFNSDLDDVIYDQLWDIFCSKHGCSETLELPEFTHKGKIYAAKTFNFSKTAEEVLDDYCEGKTQYHYDIKLTDNDTGDKYEIITDYFNDERTAISIQYHKPKKFNGKVIEQCCDSMQLVIISAKCNDTFSYKEENSNEWKEASPGELNLGNSDYVQFTFCKSCGKIHFK